MLISFSNTGSEIDPNLNIFKRGISSKGANRGIGLDVSKESIESLGGQITYERGSLTKNKPVIFRISIPLGVFKTSQ